MIKENMVNKEINALRTIYKNWKYSLSLIFITLGFFLINVFINNFDTITGNFSSLGVLGSLKFFLTLTLGFHNTIFLSTFLGIIIIGFLMGMLLTISTYKIVANKNNPNNSDSSRYLGTFGLIIGVAAPGCAACGVGILALFGISAAFLSTLPLKGFEISILSIGILSFSVWKISKGLNECNACKIQLKNDKILKKYKNERGYKN